MMKRAYASNLNPAWSLEKQRDMLADHGTLYVDELGPKALADRDTSKLRERDALLRPSSRRTDETITVCTLAVLAWTRDDFGRVLIAAAGRHATLHALHTGRTVLPDAGAADIVAALDEFQREASARHLHKRREEVSAETRAATAERIKLIADDWPKPDPPTPELLARAGRDGKPMAPATARAHLGSRPKAQAAHQREQNREAGRRAGATPGRKPKA